MDDVLDMQVGLLLNAYIGLQIQEGDMWVTVYHRGELSDDQLQTIENCLTITDAPVEPRSRIIDIL